mgnify:CR=1 FL=1
MGKKEIEIPKEASDIHGITNERVVTEPTFNELAENVSKMIEGCDLAGFNSNRFDIRCIHWKIGLQPRT